MPPAPPPQRAPAPAGGWTEPGRLARLAGTARRQWWVIALLVALGVAGGYGLDRIQPTAYQASAYVLVTPATPGAATPDPATEAQLVTSASVAGRAAALLKVATPPAALAGHVHVRTPGGSILAITFEGATPAAARDGAHAFAAAYLDGRRDAAKAGLTAQVNAATAALRKEQSALSAANDALARLAADSPQYAARAATRDALAAQVSAAQARLDDLAATPVAPGEIVTDATLPGRPASPSLALFLSCGAAAGLLAGLVLAAIRARTARRVRTSADVAHRGGLRLLATIPALDIDELLPAYGAGGAAFNRLRNEILAGMGERGRVVVVAGASRGPAATAVAANLAAALARAGSETVLVSAHAPETMAEAAPLGAMLGVAATPGLRDVLAGTTPVDAAIQWVPGQPWLRVINTGGAASTTGLLRTRALRSILDDLARRAEYVVIDAPSTAASADAQSLAGLGDAALVVIELGVTTRAEMRDAADQLRPVATGLAGTLTVPRCDRAATGAAVPDVPAPAPREGLGLTRPSGEGRAGTARAARQSGRTTAEPAAPEPAEPGPAGTSSGAGSLGAGGVATAGAEADGAANAGRWAAPGRYDTPQRNRARRPAPLRPATPPQQPAPPVPPAPPPAPTHPAPGAGAPGGAAPPDYPPTPPYPTSGHEPTVPYLPMVFVETTIEGGGK